MYSIIENISFFVHGNSINLTIYAAIIAFLFCRQNIKILFFGTLSMALAYDIYNHTLKIIYMDVEWLKKFLSVCSEHPDILIAMKKAEVTDIIWILILSFVFYGIIRRILKLIQQARA